MTAFDENRRSLLLSMAGLGMTGMSPQRVVDGGAAAGKAYVLGATAGEHLVHFRDGGDIFIKLGASTGSSGFASGTQQVKVGTGIPIHRHFKMDEAFYVLEGSGSVILNDARHPIEKGGTIFIARNTWHGFENPDRELLLLWIVSPAGLDGFFRDTC